MDRIEYRKKEYEREISIKKLVYRIFREWRILIVISLIGAVLLGGMEAAKMKNNSNVKKYSDEELAEIEKTRKIKQAELEIIENLLNNQKEYNTNSVLMRVNPLCEFIVSFDVYFDVDITNEVSINKIIKEYSSYAEGELFYEIGENLTEPIAQEYVSELIEIVTDYENNMLSFTIKGVSEEACDEMKEIIFDRLNKKKESMTGHNIEFANISKGKNVNYELAARQKSYIEIVDRYNLTLLDKQVAYNTWENDIIWDSRKVSVSDVVKKAIIGFVAACLAVLFVIISKYMLSGKLQEADDISESLGVRVIGKLPKDKKKKPLAVLDRAFASMCKVTLKSENKDTIYKVISCDIEALINALEDNSALTEVNVLEDNTLAKNNASKDVRGGKKKNINIALIGNISKEEGEVLIANLNIGSNFSLESALNMFEDPKAAKTVSEADYIILAEKKEFSRTNDIIKEIETVHAWNKKLIGAVVLNEDAV